ncbi:MAG: tRNA 2-selenouridine(34) synthase MnmH [Cyclobacteriaceae bacterium]
MKNVNVGAFLHLKNKLPLLDARSPSEYHAGHIPGAVCFPLFEDQERAEIGTRFKNIGQKAAIRAGLDFVGPKLSGFVEKAEAMGSHKLLMHCWRGGMRSQSLAWLLELYGFELIVLEGGYKAYRNALLDYFEKPPELKILAGTTGSMKTALLREMKRLGEQVVDLEDLANHQGSSFGNQLSTGQPSTEQFQNDLFEAFLQLKQNQPVWLEDESFSIGKVHLVEPLYRKMQQAPHYHLVLPKEKRIEVLVKDYGGLPKANLIQATQNISKKLGKTFTEEAIAHIKAGALDKAAGIILSYYDRAYDKSLQKKSKQIVGEFVFNGDDIENTARLLINHP